MRPDLHEAGYSMLAARPGPDPMMSKQCTFIPVQGENTGNILPGPKGVLSSDSLCRQVMVN